MNTKWVRRGCVDIAQSKETETGAIINVNVELAWFGFWLAVAAIGSSVVWNL